ncbi:hypothetical protein [Luteimonas panaciterrae]|uniref:hypothetical protein n=1 Tax=Luteimonas panaciterrae TaxID=363885 RepID=UPI001CFB2A22|nr:hypothetical protein [Luteimonas panaciterrae]
MSKALISTALATALAGIAAMPVAMAGTPTGPWAVFKYCPYNDPNVTTCVINTTTSGSFTIGTTTLPIDKPIVLQGGVVTIAPPSNTFEPLYAAVGAPTLSSPPGKVPGGLLGIVNPAPDWPFPLWQAFWNIVNSVNDVTATMESVQTIQTSLANGLYPPADGSDPTAVRLALRVRLQNPFLGSSCYIGTAQNPVVVKLQTGTTSPPAPNQPIAGSPGTANFITVTEDPYTAYIDVQGSSYVDNSFSVPKASGCGNVTLLGIPIPILTDVLEALVSGAVNLKVGLPSAAGKNTAILNGNAAIAASEYVRNSAQ